MALSDVFAISDEAVMLADGVRRFVGNLPDQTSVERRAANGMDGTVRQHFTEMGLTGLILRPEFEGLGLGASETRVLAHEIGYGLVVEPLLMSSILCAEVVQQCDLTGPVTEVLTQVATGAETLAFAAHERGSSLPMDTSCQTRLTASGDDWLLNGEKTLVIGGGIGGRTAAHFVVTAKLDSGERALVLVTADQPGVTRAPLWTVDDRAAARVTFDDVAVSQILATGEAADRALQRGLEAYAAAECAEAVGVMDRCGRLCREYLASREQFGSPLASFQALQHEVADMYIETELSRTMAMFAAHSVGKPSGYAIIMKAKAQIGLAGRKIGETSIQLHGGMGMTDEMPIGRCFKRLLFLEAHLGTPEVLLADGAVSGRN